MKLQFDGLVSSEYIQNVIGPQVIIDNYSMLLSYFTRQNGVDPNDLRQFLGINEEYEDIS